MDASVSHGSETFASGRILKAIPKAKRGNKHTSFIPVRWLDVIGWLAQGLKGISARFSVSRDVLEVQHRPMINPFDTFTGRGTFIAAVFVIPALQPESSINSWFVWNFASGMFANWSAKSCSFALWHLSLPL